MEQLTKLRTMPVSALMVKDFVTIDGSKTVAEAIQAMKQKNTDCVIVNPRNEEDAYGILTERDVLEKVIDPGEDVHRDPWNTPVHEVMSKPMVSVEPSMRIKYAIRLMKRVGVRRLAIMEGGKLLGLLSETEILHAVENLPPNSGNVAL